MSGWPQAPGYAAIIARPMDFSTIRSKLQAGDYDKESAWTELQQDMETMFTNAMTYNPAETFVHKQVRASHSPASRSTLNPKP